MHAKYRREKDIWKQWIQYIDKKEQRRPDGVEKTRDQLSNHLRENDPPLSSVSPNITTPPKTIKREMDEPEMCVMMDTSEKRQDVEVVTEPVVASSSQDAASIDLDQITIRRAPQAIPVSMRERAQAESPTPAEITWPPATNLKHRIGAQSIKQEQTNLLVLLPTRSGHLRTEGDETPRQSVSPRRCKSELDDRNNVVHAQNNNRGKGRYSTGVQSSGQLGLKTYKINAQANNGVEHAYHEVVRGKAARKRLHATDCPCCSKFYEMAGDAPTAQMPRWRSPPSDALPFTTTTKQTVGRHRTRWARSPTPPEFWDCHFPTTQEVDLEKQTNEARRMRKFAERQEASRESGLYQETRS